MLRVIVTKYFLFRFSMPDSDNHRVVVPGIGKVDQIGNHFAESGEGGIVGYVAGAKDEGGVHFVEVS